MTAANTDSATSLIEFTSDEHPRERRLALDGVRAFAVAAVIAFHAGLPNSHGGFLGVDIFFVLSGFLITSLLIDEYFHRDTISLVRFYIRRAKRLLPALALVSLVIVLLANVLLPPGFYYSLRADVVASLFYFANWHLMAAGHTYFTILSPPTPFTHTWSLAIEEQFYIIWPLVLLVVFKWRRSVVALGAVAMAVGVSSCLWMAYGEFRHWSVNRLYYGTDTHAMGLLFGAVTSCVLYELMRPGANPDRAERLRRALRFLGPLSAVLVLVIMFFAYGTSSWMFYVGFFAISVAASVAVAYLVIEPSSALSRGLSLRPIVYVGAISYGLYLWHYPVFQFLTSYWSGLAPPELFVARIVITFAAAVLSYHFVEMPIRRRHWPPNLRTALIFVSSAAVVVTLCVVGATKAQSLPEFAEPPTTTAPVVYSSLFLGDSVSVTLAAALIPYGPHYGLKIDSAGIFGCGLVPSNFAQAKNLLIRRVRLCQIRPHGQATIRQYWQREITQNRPREVVVLAGRWEETNLKIGARWYSIADPRVQNLMSGSLTSIAADAASVGARLVFINMPCAWDGERPNGTQYVENTPRRQNLYNNVLRRSAARLGARYFNIDQLVCPTGKLQYSFNGLLVRDADGIHFAPWGAPYVAPRVLPYLFSVARG